MLRPIATEPLEAEGLMPEYRVFAGCGEGGRMIRVYSFDATDDVEAERFVLDRLTEKSVELWCYSRKVARYEGKRP